MISMNKNILITVKKELRSIFRDRKTFRRLLLFPLIIPCMIILYGEMFENMDNNVETYNIGINYEVDAPTKEIIKASNLEATYAATKEELDELYESDKIDAYITYNQNTNTYLVHTDESTETGLTVTSYIQAYLESYSTYLTNNYLVEQGIDLETAYNNFNIEYEELSSGNYILGLIISVSVTYIIMSIVVATGNMATGATATERENGTLETILTFPIKKNELILGKYYSSVIIGFINSLVAFTLMILSIVISKNFYTMYEGTNLIVNFQTISISLLMLILSSLFIAGVALALCGMSKSYKEAQSSVSFLNVVALVPMLINISGAKLETFYYLIPIFNHEQILLDSFNNSLVLGNAILTIASSIVYIVAIIIFVIKAYNSEKVLFAN